jgi:hypothetical protein
MIIVIKLQEATAKHVDDFGRYTILSESRNVQPKCTIQTNKCKKYAKNMQAICIEYA